MSTVPVRQLEANPHNKAEGANPSERTPTFNDVLSEASAHMSMQAGKTKSNHVTKKMFAREIVSFLNVKYDLSPAVVISDFVGQAVIDDANNEAYKAETSKAQSQLAIATQRAAALFALEANLLEATFSELQKQIQSTMDAQQTSEYKFLPTYYEKEFVSPLERIKTDLKEKLDKARIKQVQTQQRFETLRQLATQPIMEQLQKSNKSYANLYKSMHITTFCDAVNQLDIKPAVGGGVLRQSMTASCAIDTSTVEYLRELYREAQDSKPLLHNILRYLQRRCEAKGITVEIEMGALKAAERAIEKTVEEYEGDFSRLVDLVRGSVVCNSIDDATQVIKALRELVNEPAIRQLPQEQSMFELGLQCLFRLEQVTQPLPSMAILRVKNRLRPDFAAAAESGGYRDVLINLQINGRHVCELQVHLTGFLKVKAGGGHKTYTVARSLHLLDPELSQVRVSATNFGGTDTVDDLVRKELSDALKRVVAGTCQGLYLHNFKLTLAECEALKVALQAPACNVREIALPNCGLDKHKCAALCQGVEGSLGEFLTVNLFNNRGITGECVGLFISDELRSMSLRRCRLGPSDAQAIATVLGARKPRNMTEFNVTGNDMGFETTQQLISLLTDFASMKPKSSNSNVQVDEELQEMLIFALQSRSLDAVAAICQQGARPFERSRQSQQSPFELCVSLDFPEGFDAMIVAYADPTLNLASLDNSEMPTHWQEKLYEGLQQIFSSQRCCITRLIAQKQSRVIDRVKIIQMMKRSELQLTDLDLRDNKFEANGAKLIAPSLGELKALTSLNLAGNGLGPEASKYLDPALTMMTNMSNLNLGMNRVGAEGAKHLAPGLTVMTNMTSLNLSKIGIGSEGAKHLAPALAMMTSMTNLDLNENGLGSKGANHLAPALTMMTNLTNLNLERNGLGPEGAKHLAPALTLMTNLTNLALNNNGVTPEGAQYLAPALTKMTNMTNLNLLENDLGPEGAKHLAPALTIMTNITNLDLQLNKIGPEGAQYLSPALTMTANMAHLNLENNKLGPDGAKHLAPALTMMTNMTNLNLYGNELRPEGAKSLAPALTMMTNMTNLLLASDIANIFWNDVRI